MNPQNKKIVGYENSLESLKNETVEEGKDSSSIEDCPYSKGSTFRKYWMRGFWTMEAILNRLSN